MIIPAAGKATRFNGLLKELLPVGKDETPLLLAVKRALSITGQAIIITTEEKKPFHKAALQAYDRDIYYIIDRCPSGNLWNSVRLGLEPSKDSGLILPDTVLNYSDEIPDAPLAFGVFQTDEAYRFSCLNRELNQFETKPKDRRFGIAWGMVVWDAYVSDELVKSICSTADDNFNWLMRLVNWETFILSEYHDLASFEYYKKWLESL